MNLLDGLVVAAALLAALGGYRLGFVARALSWVGLAAGLYLAARFLPQILSALHVASSTGRLALAAAVLVGGAFVGQAVGLMVGGRLHGVLPLGPLRLVDRGIGALLGVVGVVTALWLLLPAIAAVPGWPAREARSSSIARAVAANLPQPPNALEALRRLVGPAAFPQVFSALSPSSAAGAPPALNPLSAALTTSVAASTVKVQGQACSRIQDGSGFAVAPDLIVTNAHVVAGEPAGETSVLLPSGQTDPARVVYFDANRDLALLAVAGLGERPLPIGTGKVGDVGAVFGHPNGVDRLVVQPARIAQEVTADGQNLYDTKATRRDVFILASTLAPGDSGSALVGTSGLVYGVAFAIAPDRPGTSYALTSRELDAALATPRSGATVGTGPCLAG